MSTTKPITSQEIQNRFEAIDIDLEAQAKQVTEETKPQEEKEEPKDLTKDPRNKNPYHFNFKWKDARGKKWEGDFVTHMPTVRDLQNAGVLESKLNGGMPVHSIDNVTAELNFVLARLQYVLDERPNWFKDPFSIIDGSDLIQAVYAEVASFELFFRKHGKIED